jgi:hypothetical protein
LSSFKSHPNYTYMLEHVGFVQGQQYKQYIEHDTKFSQEDIRAFCAMNDSIGRPTQYSYDSDLTCSPTSLRYIWQAYIILTYFKHLAKETAIDIVEVGGGYGGLCLAIHTFAPQFQLSIRSYTILDLDAPNRLQEAYLSNFPLSFPVSFVRGYTYGATLPETNYYLISNYCFSEIESVHQSKYSITLFPKVIHGFMAWNNIPLYNLGFPYQDTDEVPNTGGQYNRYVYF